MTGSLHVVGKYDAKICLRSVEISFVAEVPTYTVRLGFVLPDGNVVDFTAPNGAADGAVVHGIPDEAIAPLVGAILGLLKNSFSSVLEMDSEDAERPFDAGLSFPVQMSDSGKIHLED